MKVILTGATGTAGSAILKACLAESRISKILVLTRSPLAERSPKVEVILHHDFSTYPDTLLDQLQGADACLWAIGGKLSQFENALHCRQVNVSYTLSAATAMAEHIRPSTGPFRFVFCSGRFAERDPSRTLLFMRDTRRVKGEIESALCELADNSPNLDVYLFRPSGFLTSQDGLVKRLLGRLYGAVETEQLAKAMVKAACEGWGHRTIENEEIVKV